MTAFCQKIFLCLIALYLSISAFAQPTTISGTVYDITRKTPVAYVSVLSNLGNGTTTDSMGKYSITVNENDSIWFSFLNKPTPKYAVANIANPSSFDISILKKIHELPNVFVKQRNYHMDSLQNRIDYEKIFNYEKPGIASTYTPGSAAGMDLTSFIEMFKFRKVKRMDAYRRHLLTEERDKYVTHRFNKGLVRKLTGLEVPQLDSFMTIFRPTYRMVVQWNDLELGQYVIEAFKYYKSGDRIDRNLLKQEAEEDIVW